jgi:hypothetical protein
MQIYHFLYGVLWHNNGKYYRILGVVIRYVTETYEMYSICLVVIKKL